MRKNISRIAALAALSAVVALSLPHGAEARTWRHRSYSSTYTTTSAPAPTTVTTVTQPAPTVAPSPTTTTTVTAPTISPTVSPWSGTTIFDGYGTVTNSGGALYMSPQAATQPSETHAALVVSTQSVHQPYQLSYTMNTTRQLRTGSTPNAWEVGWVVFGYTSEGKFKYLTMKPNGLELGESLLNLQQTFLYTSSDQFPINQSYNVVLTAKNNVITATVNGKQYMQYTMSSKDALSLDGRYGFYTEDASVQVSNIQMQQL